MKRTFDIAVASIGLVCCLPLFIVLSFIVCADSRGPIFYGAERVGYRGRVFKMWKFRTMIQGADKVGPFVTRGNDPRITRAGKYLRRAKLDELPSLWNVLVGEMSLVGPRPESPTAVARYSAEQEAVFSVRPGITSLASIKYRNEEALLAEAEDLEQRYWEIMQDKLRMDLEYIANASLVGDMRILFRTMAEVVKG